MMLLNLLCRLQLHSRSLANIYYRFRMISSTNSALDTLYPMGLCTIIGHGKCALFRLSFFLVDAYSATSPLKLRVSIT